MPRRFVDDERSYSSYVQCMSNSDTSAIILTITKTPNPQYLLSSPSSPAIASSIMNPYLDTEGSPSKFDPRLAMSGTIIRHSAPNSGKKRRPLSILSRALPSPSHSAPISMIFRDADVSIRAYDSASASSPLSKEYRMPVRQAQLTPFGRGSDSRSLKARKVFKPDPSSELLRMNSRKILTNSAIHVCFHPSRSHLAHLEMSPNCHSASTAEN